MLYVFLRVKCIPPNRIVTIGKDLGEAAISGCNLSEVTTSSCNLSEILKKKHKVETESLTKRGPKWKRLTDVRKYGRSTDVHRYEKGPRFRGLLTYTSRTSTQAYFEPF